METLLQSLMNLQKIINSQLDIKLRLFSEEQLDAVLKTIKGRNATGLDVIPPEVWRQENMTTCCFDHAKHNRKIDERLHPPLPQERRPRNSNHLYIFTDCSKDNYKTMCAAIKKSQLQENLFQRKLYFTAEANTITSH